MSIVDSIALALVVLPLLLVGYAYIGYPLLLKLLCIGRPRAQPVGDPAEWPMITVTLPCYNEERRLRPALEAILAADYPPERRQLLVISDASNDGTDSIAREFASRGVELLRQEQRRGKSAAENAGARVARGEILVNTDASVRIRPDSLKALLRVFQDPHVGVASGRDLSVGDDAAHETRGEAGYVGYEMEVRALETRLDSIVGASGCFFGIRRAINEEHFPEGLSRDFASALMAREHGYRAVSVDDAICLVPRTTSLRTEQRRKVRTMARGIETLWYKRHLMNPLEHGLFAWMLISHKLCRWLVYAVLPLSLVGMMVLALHFPAGRWMAGAIGAGVALGIIGSRWPDAQRTPPMLAPFSFMLATQLAGVQAWLKVLRGDHTPVWEPTRREGTASDQGSAPANRPAATPEP